MARKNAPSEMEPRFRRMRSKNLALLAVLASLVVLFYVITIVRMGSGS
ncbi:MAG: hypothetical protein QNJ92_00670 [Alphaproteobacteria bacterium]|nr:hypothetical protein [Alphaproteobacteria bacterium]